MKFLVVAGARPNFMKIAPILDAFRLSARPDVVVRLVHTGQHYDRKMSAEFFEDLGIPAPDFNLGVGSGSHAQQTARILMAFEEVCLAEQPDWVLVVGDVNSTVACALTAKKLGIRVAHVEAGLRSRDMAMPEEINRLCTDAISDLLFTTDALANENLRREGVPEERIRLVGNTMIDTLFKHIERARSLPLPVGFVPGGYAVLTLHRPGNVDHRETLTGLFGALADISRKIPLLFPAHPRTLKKIAEFGLAGPLRSEPGITVVDPVSYLPFLGMVARARMVLTDSGGIQEETTVLGIPCITMRTTTERPITCQVGSNILAGNDPSRIRRAALEILEGPVRKYGVPKEWDGHAGKRVVEAFLGPGGAEGATRSDHPLH